MNSDIAIKVSNLSKKYTIGKQKDSSLRGSLSTIFKSSGSNSDEFWALKDVSFEIKKGDVIGIIGKNGAGKSTLLKILSQITKPTEGRIEINGRVASLLEVGTGFHPELTGRENIYLNGTILGMTRKEVKEKFDEIVAFSGVEKFIDTPVKHYSSGMYVRLAFAVAAHLDPEILIIDEVLAVGDAAFQKKCLGKMEQISNQGRTVIFVSHDLSAVSSLCSQGIFLDQGSIKFIGDIEKTINNYTVNDQLHSKSVKIYTENDAFKEFDGTVLLKKLQIIDSEGNQIYSPSIEQEFGISLEYDVLNEDFETNPVPNIHLFHSKGGRIFVSIDNSEKEKINKKGSYQSVLWIPSNFLNHGNYSVGIAISTLETSQVHISDYNAITFEVLDNLNSITRNGYTGKMDGYIRPYLKWTNKLKLLG